MLYFEKKKRGDFVSKFHIRQVKSGLKFDLRAGNGEIIAVSESYTSPASCRKGIESIRLCAVRAALEDQTAPENREKCPKFQLYTDKRGQFRFRLLAANGKIIAVSEGYTTKAACLNGIDSVRVNAPTAEIETQSDDHLGGK